MDNKVYMENGKAYFTPYGERTVLEMDLTDIKYSEGVFILPSGVCIPEDSPFACEQEVFAAWRELHKNDIIMQTIPTTKAINAQVVAKIRERYSIDEEFKMLNLGILDPTDVEYNDYRDYVYSCRLWGEEEKMKYGLV